MSEVNLSAAPKGNFWHRLANPARFERLARWLTPWFLLGFLGFVSTGLYFGLYASPIDYQQKDTVRIMYVHVPAAWLAMMTYSTLAISGFVFLVWRHPLAEVAGLAAAPIGAAFYCFSSCDWSHMGTAYLGNLVGLGCTSYLGFNLILSVYRVYSS